VVLVAFIVLQGLVFFLYFISQIYVITFKPANKT